MPTSPSLKRRITPAERAQFRQELIDIARHIFLSEGYAAVTIRRITAEAGVTPMAFYWYFECKDSLLTVIWDDILRDAAQHCRERSHHAATPEEQVNTYFAAMLDFWLTHRDFFRFIFLGDSSKQVDLISLRSRLPELAGVQQIYLDFDALIRACFAWQQNADIRTEQFRKLAVYRAFGFLHSAIGLYNYDAEQTATHCQLVVDDLRQTLRHWCLPEAGWPSPAVTQTSNVREQIGG